MSSASKTRMNRQIAAKVPMTISRMKLLTPIMSQHAIEPRVAYTFRHFPDSQPLHNQRLKKIASGDQLAVEVPSGMAQHWNRHHQADEDQGETGQKPCRHD